MAFAAQGHDGQPNQLHGGHPDVAAPGVEPEGPALEPDGVEGVNVGHGGGEVAASHPADGGGHQQGGEGHPWLKYHGQERAGHQQQQGADQGPVATPETSHREGVGDAHGRSHRAADGGEEELLGRLEAVLGAEEQHEHRPQTPDGEPDVLGEDGEDQVTAGDLAAPIRPELGIFRPPVENPTTPEAPIGAAGPGPVEQQGCGR